MKRDPISNKTTTYADPWVSRARGESHPLLLFVVVETGSNIQDYVVRRPMGIACDRKRVITNHHAFIICQQDYIRFPRSIALSCFVDFRFYPCFGEMFSPACPQLIQQENKKSETPGTLPRLDDKRALPYRLLNRQNKCGFVKEATPPSHSLATICDLSRNVHPFLSACRLHLLLLTTPPGASTSTTTTTNRESQAVATAMANVILLRLLREMSVVTKHDTVCTPKEVHHEK